MGGFEKKVLVTAFQAVKMFATSPDAHVDDFDKTKVQYMNKAINRTDTENPGFSILETRNGDKSKTDLIEYFKTGKLGEKHEVWQNANQFTKSEHLLSTTGKLKNIYLTTVPLTQALPNITFEGSPVSEIQKTKPKATPHRVTVGASNQISKFVSNLVKSPQKETTMEDRLVSTMQAMIDKSTVMLGSVINDKFESFWTADREKLVIDTIGQSSHFEELIDKKIVEVSENKMSELAEEIRNQVGEEVDEKVESKIEEKLAELGAFDHSKMEARIIELENTHKANTELLMKNFEDQMSRLTDKTKENKNHLESAITTFNAKLATKSETRTLTATVIASEYVEHQTIASAYRKQMANALNNGQVIINLVDENLYTMDKKDPNDEASPTIPIPNLPEIQLILKRKISQTEDATLGRKMNRPIFKAKIGDELNSRSKYRPTQAAIHTATRSMLTHRIDYKNKLGISIDTKDGTNINVYLNALVRTEIISDFTSSRLGRLVVFINDGDTGINFNDPAFNEDLFSEYKDTCTRLMPESPALLAKLDDPTVTKLRALARRTHFVGPETRHLIKYPANGREQQFATEIISEFFDDVANELESLIGDTVDLLGSHLESQPVHTGFENAVVVQPAGSSIWSSNK